MPFLSNDRGVSEVLGAILVFALVLAVLVIIQVAGVPAANEKIEFEHNTRVQADFQEFDQNVDRAAALGAKGSSSLETGVRYPPRLFLINPGPAAGTVTMGTSGDAVFKNMKAVNDETDEYFDSQPSDELTFPTKSLSYNPSYNEYGSAPTTTYEHGVLYNSDTNGAAVFAEGGFISGNRISLTVLDGSLSESSTKSVALETTPISGPAKTVSVQDRLDDGTPITIQLQTRLSQEAWNEILADEPYVTAIDVTGGQLTVDLDPSVTYDLRLSKVGVGSDVTEEGTKYLTKAGDTNPVINRGGSQFIVEARDGYNNAVAGVDVTFTSSAEGKFVEADGSLVKTITVQTDESGQSIVKFKPDADDDTVTITGTAEFDSDDTDTSNLEEVKYVNVPVERAGDSVDPSDDINPSGDFVVQTGASIVDQTVEVYFLNRNTATWELTEARVNYYFVASSSGNNKRPTAVDLELGGSATQQLDVSGDYEQLSPNIDFVGEQAKTLTFSNWQFPGNSKPNDQDFFIITLLFDTDGDGDDDERGVYFVGARSDGGVPPVADAGPNQNVDVDVDVTFDGSDSSDSDGSITSYEWDVDDDGTYELTGANPTYTGGYSSEGDKTVTLRVTDDDSQTSTDTMTVTVTSGAGGNAEPTADAGPNKTVPKDDTVELTGSGTDSDGTITSYSWTIVNDPSKVSLINATTATPTFKAESGSQNNDYTVKLVVTDDDGATDEDTVTVSVTN